MLKLYKKKIRTTYFVLPFECYTLNNWKKKIMSLCESDIQLIIVCHFASTRAKIYIYF